MITPYVDPTGSMSPDEINSITINTMLTSLNQINNQLTTKQTQIIPDSTGISRILIGAAPDGQIGIFISKPTFDILQQFTLP